MLGVDKAVGNYTGCAASIGKAFAEKADYQHGSTYYVANLLERGVKVLVYVGESAELTNASKQLLKLFSE